MLQSTVVPLHRPPLLLRLPSVALLSSPSLLLSLFLPLSPPLSSPPSPRLLLSPPRPEALRGLVQVFDLSATIKKMRKGGSTEFRKVLFYPSQRAVDYANTLLKARGTAPGSPELFPASPVP